MEPRIQYAKTEDGVSIAFSTMGEGTPFVQMAHPFSHLQLDWEIAEWRSWNERMAKGRQIVNYDSRGTGLSDRDAMDFSLDAGVRDLEAVVARLGLERFALMGLATSGPAGVAYAARNPERVSHLILWNSSARTADMLGAPQAQALSQMAGADWETYTETLAHVGFGWAAGEEARQYAAIIRESVTQEWLLAYLAAADVDAAELLPQVGSPTLVLQRRQVFLPSLDATRGLVSRIPNAHLVLLEGTAGAPHVGDSEAVLRAIDEFLGEGADTASAPQEPGAFRTILFTDVEGSTALTDRVGDAKARELLREHERITREALKAHGGSEVKTMGDGFMASFGSATGALECAIAMQRAFASWNASLRSQGSPSTGSGRTEEIRVRIGLNAGEPIAEDDPDGRGDLFGTAVNMAARIASKADAGEILASNVVRELVAGKGFLFNDRGDTELRGFEDPVRIYEVRWEESE